MRKDRMLFVCCWLSVLGIGLPAAWGQGPVVITSHHDGDTVYWGAQVTLQCSGGKTPLTWSGGTFSPSVGSEVTWTAPSSGASAIVTVTDECGSTDSVTFHLAHVIFVDVRRTGPDGTTWLRAYKTLQEGLAAAGAGCEVWVAEGTYRPDEDADHPNGNGTNEPYRSFALPAGVGIYGGFAGDETVRVDARERRGYRSILSGDLHRSTPPSLDGGNSYRVVTCSSGTGTTVLDNCIITMGYSGYDGPGISLENCSPTISNCLIMQNWSLGEDGDGGGMHCYRASPTVTNCVFQDNRAGDDGGGLCNKNGSNGTFTNCVFYRNHTQGDEPQAHGGGIFNTRGEQAGYIGSTPTFRNCVIVDNNTASAGDGGGAADNDTGTNVTWINCTFYSNQSADDGGGLATRDGAASTVTNCIFWSNTSGGNGAQLWQGGNPDGTAAITYSDIQGGGFAGTGNIDSNPTFYDTADPNGADNRFLTSDDGLGLVFGSPCIDTATSAGAPLYDATSAARPVDGDGNGTTLHDMGAYEFAALRKGPYLIYPGQTGTPDTTAQMTVLWQLTGTRACTLEWGTSTSYGSSHVTTESDSQVDGHQHSYTITGLSLATRYYYRIREYGSAAAGDFYTAPAPAATSVNFLVVSDTQGSGGQPAGAYNGICGAMVNTFASGYQTFVLHCGDRAEFGGSEASWDNEFFARSQTNAMTLLAKVPILGSLGNHELRDAGNNDHTQAYYRTTLNITLPFRKYWPYPFAPEIDTSYWSFDYGPVHVVMLDEYATGTATGSNRLTTDEITWLQNDLANTNRAWRVVIFHEPGYAGYATGGTVYDQVQDTLEPIFENANTRVDIVFAGHRHYYCHSLQNTVTHITTGGGGGGITDLDPNESTPWFVSPTEHAQGQVHHFCRVAIAGNQLTCTPVRANGTAIETVTLQHQP